MASVLVQCLHITGLSVADCFFGIAFFPFLQAKDFAVQSEIVETIDEPPSRP